MKIIPSSPASQSEFPDLERVARTYQPPGAICPPAGFARAGATPWTLARLLDPETGPIPDHVAAWAG